MASPSLSMLAAVPFEHTHFTPSHSRSASAASNSSTFMSHEDLFFQHRHPHIAPTHTRHSSGASQSTSYSLGASLHTPADSPPSMANYKNHISRSTHIRRARAASSPYGRDDGMLSGSESLRSSSSEAEDMTAAFFAPPDYGNMFVEPQGISPEAMQAAAGFGQMTLGPTQQLEQLAANVRAATTTSASDRAKQIFVQAWLTANYAPYADGNVPRQGLYNSYRNICDVHGIPHINTATLGKAIRLCFPAIKTRRLGVRGNSKYHYCGIRPVTATEVAFLQEFIRKSNQQAQLAMSMLEPAPAPRQTSLNLGVETKSGLSASLDDKTPTTNTLLSAAQGSRKPTDAYTPAQIRSRKNTVNDDTATPSTTIPKDTTPYVVPQTMPLIEEALGPNASVTSPQNVAAREVWRWFEAHLDGLMESVRTFRFDQFEIHLRTFWAGLSGDHREVVHAPAVAGLMAKADAMVYDEILELLRSQVLAPIPPQALTSLHLLVALENFGSTFVEPKVELGARFGHLILRFLDIFQVTQALSSVLTNPKQLSDMRRSWRDIDFESVRNQSALVCNCRHEDLVQLLEVDFTTLLDSLAASSEPVRDVMAWADGCCERLMGARTNGQERATMSSRSVLIRWQYVTSQIMRDLTIRSDPAFGAFQILKLFMDDWIALNVLRTVALSTNSVAASVEPVIQQQFFTMADQDTLAPPDFANAMDSRMQNHLTPTTSSMLAALNDSFPASLDASASVFHHNGPYDNMGFGQSGFDMASAFSQDSVPHPPSSSGSPEPSSAIQEGVKNENPVA
ncbi:RFX-like transcription factor daf-19 [Rhizoctonia solani]|uniref:RFX-like transcription factor daf-19 n=1 Tax=Rhizoctonia solani TaxID=456999 RepID=A0A8H8STG0_9AGAM|nr:RFX-like transcription factor daf-19 [Rhizoctonia solani]QRW16033.1 RFX-like transcription factor daf-19 [Rhizoctonia solani]